MRIPGLSRRWLIAGAVSLAVVLTATIGLVVVYPRVGAWMIRTKLGGKLAGRRVALKDNICLAGVPMMIGAQLLEGYVPEVDATIVERILDAGGEILQSA